MKGLKNLSLLLGLVVMIVSCDDTEKPARGEQGVIIEKPDISAEFPGGENELYMFLAENTIYPESAVGDGPYGKVYISAMIMEDGSIGSVTLSKSEIMGPEDDLIQAAIDAVNKMPKWKPAMKDGKAVPMVMTIPFVFPEPTEDF